MLDDGDHIDVTTTRDNRATSIAMTIIKKSDIFCGSDAACNAASNTARSSVCTAEDTVIDGMFPDADGIGSSGGGVGTLRLLSSSDFDSGEAGGVTFVSRCADSSPLPDFALPLLDSDAERFRCLSAL